MSSPEPEPEVAAQLPDVLPFEQLPDVEHTFLAVGNIDASTAVTGVILPGRFAMAGVLIRVWLFFPLPLFT